MLKDLTENLHDEVWTTHFLILILQISLTITALLGFGLYLWYLKSSDEHTQSRLLNILNGYLSLTCIGFSLTLSTIYSLRLSQDVLIFIGVEIGGVHIIAVATTFLLISWATILNHFNPGLYLDISVSWSHKVAIPAFIFAFILVEQALYFSCQDTFPECNMLRVRTFVMIPATLTSFLCQLLVIIDDIWGWKKIYGRLRGLCRQNIVSPENDEDIELQVNQIQPNSQPQSHDPAQGIHQNLVN